MDVLKILEKFSLNIVIVLILIGAIMYLLLAPRLEKKRPPLPPEPEPEPEPAPENEKAVKKKSDWWFFYMLWEYFK